MAQTISTITLYSNAQTVTYGSTPVTIGAQIVCVPNYIGSTFKSPPATGDVKFIDYDGAQIADAPVTGMDSFHGSAFFMFTPLQVGPHPITGAYSGDAYYLPSTSPTFIEYVIKAATQTAISSKPNPSPTCKKVDYVANVSQSTPLGVTPTGFVTFTIDSTVSTQVALNGGVATYTPDAFSTAGSHSVSAYYGGDNNYEASASPTITQNVSGPSDWAMAALAVAVDPWQGTPLCPTGVDGVSGNAQVQGPQIDPSQSSSCNCGCACSGDGSTAAQSPVQSCYNSGLVNVRPFVLAAIATDACTVAASQFKLQLTWNGTPQGTQTFSGNSSPGAVNVFPLQVASPVLTTGYYPWTVDALVSVGGTTITPTQASGSLPVGIGNTTPFGIGWSLGGVRSLFTGGSVAMTEGGKTGARSFGGTPTSLPFTFMSPPNDQGTMTQNADYTYTYTAKDRTIYNFDGGGRQTSRTDPHGKTLAFAYDSNQRLRTITHPDGGVATLNYSSFSGGAFLTSVEQPGSRMLTYSYDGGNRLTKIIDAAGNVSTFSYDSNNRMVNHQVGPLNTTYSYDANSGTVASVDQGFSTVTDLVAQVIQGLGGGVPAPNIVQSATSVKDARSQVTSHSFDNMGRLQQVQHPDGTSSSWALNSAGNPVSFTDAFGRITTRTYDSLQNLIQEQYPDGSSANYHYDPTWNKVTTIQNELGHVTTRTYDPVTSDLLTESDALGNVTTFTWSDALMQTKTDPLGRATSYVWDASRRRLLSETDPLGNQTTYGYDAAGNRTSEKDPLGRITTSVYDGNRQLISRMNPLGGIRTMTYDYAGNLIGLVDELGRKTTYAYDSRMLQTAVVEPISAGVSRTTTMNYDALMNLLSTIDPSGDITSYGYDSLNRRVIQKDGYGSSVQRQTTMAYDAVGNVLSTTDQRGVITSFAYDARNRQTQRIEAYGTNLARTNLSVYDAAGNVRTTVDPRGVMASYSYDANERQVLRIDAYGTSAMVHATTTVYDAVGRVQSTTNPIGAKTTYGYDALDRQVSVTEAFGDAAQRTTTSVYDAVGNRLSTTNPRGYVTSFVYDALNRPVKRLDAYGDALQRQMTMVYDAVGNLLSESNGLNVVTSYAYDSLNRRTRQIDAYGSSLARTSTLAYDASDNLTSFTDPLGFAVTYSYDALNRRFKTQNPDGGVATVAYDANDNVVVRIDPLGHETTYIYDALNRQTQSIDARGGIVTLSYDPNNNLASLTDPVHNTTTWLYDALNRRIVETDPLSNQSVFAYDGADRLIYARDRSLRVVTSTYDQLNRLTGETWINALNIQVNVQTFSYDANNNLLAAANQAGIVTMAYDSLDRLSSSHDVFNNVITNSYDAANNRTVVQDSLGATTTRVYDGLNRVTTMLFGGPGQTPVREDLSYTVRDQYQKQTRYSDLAGTTTVAFSTFGYDSMRRPTNIQHLDGGAGNIASYTNTYDLAGRITSEVANGRTTTYSYDTTDQLTNDSVVSYSYDANGNRTMAGYVSGAANRLLSDGVSTYGYDANGNQISKKNLSTGEIVTYSYDNRNRLTGAQDSTSGPLATYAYDALGQRVESDVHLGGVTTVTRFVSDDSSQVWADTDSGNNLVQRYVRGERILDLRARVSADGTAIWLLPDRMGSIRNAIVSSGLYSIIYDGYGNAVSETTSKDGGAYKYDGYRFDPETGLYRPDPSTARYYDPRIGRWLSEDPIRIGGSDANLLRYVFNVPTQLTDWDGLKCKMTVHSTPVLGIFTHYGLTVETDVTGLPEQFYMDAGPTGGKLSAAFGLSNVQFVHVDQLDNRYKPTNLQFEEGDESCLCIWNYATRFNSAGKPYQKTCTNSNWALKCALNHCGLDINWGSTGSPIGWAGCDECKSFTCMQARSHTCGSNVECVKWGPVECP